MSARELTGKTVLITGATGFVGARLVEKLFHEHQVGAVRAVVRGFQKVPRITCYPVELLDIPLTEGARLAAAVRGVDVIFHLAHDGGLDGAVRSGLEALAGAAVTNRVRLVNLSSAAVYGAPLYSDKGGVIEEDTAQGALSVDADAAKAKREAEAYLDGVDGLDVVHLQPQLIYGPYSRKLVDTPLAQLAAGRVAVLDEGRAPMNLVYVDDVVHALARAAVVREASGQSFLLAPPRQHTWRDYYAALEAMIARQVGDRPSRIHLVTPDDLKGLRASQNKAAARALYSAVTDQSIIIKAERLRVVERSLDVARRRLPGIWGRLTTLRKAGAPPPLLTAGRPSRGVDALPVQLPDDTTAALQRSRAALAAYKAMRVLGYAPRFDLELGMAQVESYARWSRLV